METQIRTAGNNKYYHQNALSVITIIAVLQEFLTIANIKEYFPGQDNYRFKYPCALFEILGTNLNTVLIVRITATITTLKLSAPF